MALPIMSCAMWFDYGDEIDLNPNPDPTGFEKTTKAIAPQSREAIEPVVAHVRQVFQ